MKKELARTMTVALSKFIDENRRGGMCMSSVECEAMEKAFIADDFEKIGDYVEKKLAESEDERIVNWLYDMLKRGIDGAPEDCPDNPIAEKALAWLEKQKEQKPTNGIYWHAIKKGERLPCPAYIWTTDFEKYFNSFDGRLLPNMENAKVGADTWYLPAKDVRDLPREGVDELPKEQKPVGWSEEDEENFAWFDKFFRAESVVAGGRDIPQDKYLWFKSLRPQPQGIYQQVVKGLRDMCDRYEQNGMFTDGRARDFLDNVRVKCKDAIECAPILDESSWKPSEEQMEALRKTVHKLANTDVADSVRLSIMYDNLKKL